MGAAARATGAASGRRGGTDSAGAVRRERRDAGALRSASRSARRLTGTSSVEVEAGAGVGADGTSNIDGPAGVDIGSGSLAWTPKSSSSEPSPGRVVSAVTMSVSL
jgi:hypothetical protein